MPVHIQNLTSEVTPLEADFPLSPEQIERLVQIVLRRLEQHQHDEQQHRESTALRPSVLPPLPIGE